MFELATGTATALFIANRVSPKYVPLYWAVVVIGFAALSFAMWMHDAGYVTLVSNRIDSSRAEKAQRIADAIAAEQAQILGWTNSLWTSSVSTGVTGVGGWTVGLWLTPPLSRQDPIGVVNVICRVLYVEHGTYRGSAGTGHGDLGLSLAFPQDFQPQGTTVPLRWPLPEGAYQVEWTGAPGYSTRCSFQIDSHGNLA